METTEDNAAAGPSNSSNRSSLEDKDPPVSVDDTEEASDEVKVYENEEEDEDEPKTNSQQSSGVVLSDDKSGLINESEQSKDTRQHDHAFAASKFLKYDLGQQILEHHSAFPLDTQTSCFCFLSQTNIYYFRPTSGSFPGYFLPKPFASFCFLCIVNGKKNLLFLRVSFLLLEKIITRVPFLAPIYTLVSSFLFLFNFYFDLFWSENTAGFYKAMPKEVLILALFWIEATSIFIALRISISITLLF